MLFYNWVSIITQFSYRTFMHRLVDQGPRPIGATSQVAPHVCLISHGYIKSLLVCDVAGTASTPERFSEGQLSRRLAARRMHQQPRRRAMPSATPC